MNSMQIANENKPKTIGELKKYLADLEASWTDEDKQYLGEFDDQYLYIDTPQGVAYAYFQYHGEFGLIAFLNQVI